VHFAETELVEIDQRGAPVGTDMAVAVVAENNLATSGGAASAAPLTKWTSTIKRITKREIRTNPPAGRIGHCSKMAEPVDV
jgi:hypothetical protein